MYAAHVYGPPLNVYLKCGEGGGASGRELRVDIPHRDNRNTDDECKIGRIVFMMSRSNETNQVERAAQGEGKRAKHTARWMFECMGGEFVVTRDIFISAKLGRIEEIREKLQAEKNSIR